MAFISIVGNQIMAVLNPILAMHGEQIIPEDMFLLYTVSGHQEQSVSETNAKKIARWIQQPLYKTQAHLIPVSNSLLTDSRGNPAVQEVIRDLTDRHARIFFNVGGGMNFQIAACMMELDPGKTTYYYPQSDGVQKIDLLDAVVHNEIIRHYKSADVSQILSLQGIPYTVEKGSQNPWANRTLQSLFRDCFGKDDKTVSGWYERNLKIGEVVFDRVYNCGNELVFIKAVGFDDRLDDIRRIINLAGNRKDFGELLHHKIIIVTDLTDFIERLKTESQGKLIIVNPKMDACATLKGIFSVQSSNKSMPPDVCKKTGTKVKNSTVLYLALGRELMPSLIALWSHAPQKACFFYTPNNEVVQSYVDNMLHHSSLLPCEEVHFLPCGIDGKEILEFQPDQNQEVEVNITPGTKGHTAFLSLFAQLHNGEVWSISDKLMKIGSGERKPILAPDIDTFLEISGIKTTRNMRYESEDDWHNKGLSDFLKVLTTHNRLTEFPKLEITLAGDSFIFKNKNKNGTPITGTISRGGHRHNVILKHDAWFESLMAYAMRNAGADEVRLNLTIPWSDSTSEIILKRLNQRAEERQKSVNVGRLHKTEIDVVARFNSKLFVISCKSGERFKRSMEIANIKGARHILGRFAFPLLASFKHKGEPEKVDGVFVFGYDTFSKPEKMKELLARVEKESKTTILLE